MEIWSYLIDMTLQDHNDIDRWDGANYGSICQLQLVKKKYVNAINYKKTGYFIEVESLSLQSGARLVTLDFFRPNDTTHTEEPQISSQGLVYQQSIQVKIKRDQLAVTRWLHDFANAEVIAILKDFNGNQKLVGELERPLVLKSKFDRGSQITSLQYHQFTLEGMTKHLSTWFNGVVSENTSECSGELGTDLYYTADQSGGLVAQVGGELHCWINKTS